MTTHLIMLIGLIVDFYSLSVATEGLGHRDRRFDDGSYKALALSLLSVPSVALNFALTASKPQNALRSRPQSFDTRSWVFSRRIFRRFHDSTCTPMGS